MSGPAGYGEIRRRRSTDTLSTFDEVSPPYALSDVGRPRDDPEIGTRLPQTLQNNARGYRVDDMWVSWSGPRIWMGGASGVIKISVAASIDLPRSDRIVVESLKGSIRRGHQLCESFHASFMYGDGSSAEDFYFKLSTLWQLCVMFGAVICQPHNFVSEEVAAILLKEVDYVREVIERVENDYVSKCYPRVRQRPSDAPDVIDDILNANRRELDISIVNMTDWNFEMSSYLRRV